MLRRFTLNRRQMIARLVPADSNDCSVFSVLRSVNSATDPIRAGQCSASSSGRSTTLSCSFGSVRAMTAVQVSVALGLYGRCGTPAGM